MIHADDLLDKIEKIAIALGKEQQLRQQVEQRTERPAIAPHDVHALLDYIATNQKIEAIKMHRQITGVGLKESKDAIERITSRYWRIWYD